MVEYHSLNTVSCFTNTKYAKYYPNTIVIYEEYLLEAALIDTMYIFILKKNHIVLGPRQNIRTHCDWKSKQTRKC